MKKINTSTQSFLIILLALCISVAFSFLPNNLSVFGYQLKYIDMLGDVKAPADQPAPVSMNTNSTIKASVMNPELFAKIINYLIGSEKANSYTPAGGSFLYGDLNQLNNFFDALKSAKSKGARIAYYGDSAIEGDYITADFRENLQSKFGGSTVGHLGIVSQDINFRTTTKHSFSPDNTWEVGSLYGGNFKNYPVGVSGEVAIPKGNAWVRYEVIKYERSLKEFTAIRIFYTNAKASAIKVYFNDSSSPKSINLTAGSGVKELVIKSDSPAKSVKVEFPDKDQAYLFGISLEGETGVYVDNFPLRGNTGVDIEKIPDNVLKDYAKYFDYKLIVLEFGLNISGQKDYVWYEREMTKIITRFKSIFPKASILLVSAPDKAVKQGTKFVTDPALAALIQAQKNIADKNNVALFNLFDAMGGLNSMEKWVNANPPLASRDYSHVNASGAKKVADLITQSLMDEFNKRK